MNVQWMVFYKICGEGISKMAIIAGHSLTWYSMGKCKNDF